MRVLIKVRNTIENIKLTARIAVKVYKSIASQHLVKGDVVNYVVKIDVK
jgi:hypothetical protein